ncbi:hypothetical protein FB45DRAFT_520691 [Roridomyces roridus]|uniref:Uncharacterized protein n=1 Tax=Roridomyces roridus TaxID=1738132 RepID=A0AAD7BXF8_9AGAR|nr:hypothetical protein FB45DRAFT_520691 [Roridomyces roridus]
MELSSTTETKSYILEKYSRSYSLKDAKAEWTHFTNPVLRLVLDTKHSAEKVAESLRMRVVWTMNGGSVSGAEQDVVLEDLDLLAFSSLDRNQSESSPLKGVYRDTTFGLRYLHGPPGLPDSEQVYRRFQVSFATASAALQLVEAIRDVCPCKSTDATAQMKKKIMPPTTRVPQSPWKDPASFASTPLPHGMPTAVIPALTFPVCTVPNTADSVLVAEPASKHFRPMTTLTKEIPSLPLILSSSSPAPSSYQHSSPPVPTNSTSNDHLDPLPKPNMDSFPESSPPDPSFSVDTAMPPPSLPSASNVAAAAEDTDIDMVEALREATGLYDLGQAALERLVGDVVREDRFGLLLEKMSKMWAAKAVVAAGLGVLTS